MRALTHDEQRKVEANIPLVYHVLGRSRFRPPRGFEHADLESVAILGLCGAVTGYDPTRGFAWTTYATRCIRNAVSRWLRDTVDDEDPLSLDAPVAEVEGGESTLGDLLPSPERPPDQAILARELLAALPDREQAILDLIYLRGASRLGLSRETGISRQRLTQMEERALKRLRKAIA